MFYWRYLDQAVVLWLCCMSRACTHHYLSLETVAYSLKWPATVSLKCPLVFHLEFNILLAFLPGLLMVIGSFHDRLIQLLLCWVTNISMMTFPFHVGSFSSYQISFLRDVENSFLLPYFSFCPHEAPTVNAHTDSSDCFQREDCFWTFICIILIPGGGSMAVTQIAFGVG